MDSTPQPDASLDDQLRALPARLVDPGVDARALRAARAVLGAPTSPSGQLSAWLAVCWERAVAPLLVTGTVASYLAWAFLSAGALYR